MHKDNKRFVVEANFIKQALKKQLSLSEFLLLLYFDNEANLAFNIDLISKSLNMDSNTLIDAYSKLISKGIIKVKAEKNENNKIEEIINVDDFYEDIKIDNKEKEKKEEKTDIFSEFENSFGRTLSSMEYEIINAWIDKGFSLELISAALKEAVYNGVTNLRYIDKVLYEWNKKGYKNQEDIKKGLIKEDSDSALYETELMNFDWLHEKE